MTAMTEIQKARVETISDHEVTNFAYNIAYQMMKADDLSLMSLLAANGRAHKAQREETTNPEKRKALSDKYGVITRSFLRTLAAGKPLPVAPASPPRRSRGQLWEECPSCGTEPVCAGCGYCDTHCCCGAANSYVSGEVYGGED